MKKPENSLLINVHATPSDEVKEQCVKISQSLKSDDTMFALDGVTKFPHMTVFMARFANDQVENVVSAVKQALVGVESFPCQHTGYFMTNGRYFEVSYAKTEPFMALHKKLIEALKGFRINPGDPYEEAYFTPNTPEQRKNAEETGYDLVNGLYRPHVTLVRYFEGKVPEKTPKPSSADLSFSLAGIGVYKADDNGAVYEKLAEFSV